MVNLKANPYYLTDEDIAWVENTIAGMSAEEKVGQLFWQLTASQDEAYLKDLMETYHLGSQGRCCSQDPWRGRGLCTWATGGWRMQLDSDLKNG